MLEFNNDRFNSIISLSNKVAKLYGDNSFNPSLHSNKREYLEGIENINMEFPMPDIDDFIDHIDYVVDLIGVDYVGISSDFGGGGGSSGWMDASETKLLTRKLKKKEVIIHLKKLKKFGVEIFFVFGRELKILLAILKLIHCHLIDYLY